MPRSIRSPRRVAAVVAAGLTAAVVLLSASTASAHVEAEGETSTAGLTTVTFSFSHGCTGSPTTSLKVKLPAGTTEVAAENPTGWTSTSDADQLTWTGGSIPDHDPGTFTVTMRIVGQQGQTIFLPTIQGCAAGENAWIEQTDDPEADNAAPRIVLAETVAAPSSTVTTATPTTAASTDTTTDAQARDAQIVEDSENSPIGVIVIIVVVLIIAGGALILYLRNRRPSST